jgi:hypothetical protein
MPITTENGFVVTDENGNVFFPDSGKIIISQSGINSTGVIHLLAPLSGTTAEFTTITAENIIGNLTIENAAYVNANNNFVGTNTFASYITGSITGSVAKFTSITGSFSGNGSNITNLNYSNISNPPSIPTVGNATVTIAAGNGLTDGGSLTTNQTGNSTITLNVGAGTGISVANDSVAIDTTVIPTLAANNSFTGTNTFSSPVIASITGNSATSTKLQTSRTIQISGDVVGSTSFDGSANAVITSTLSNSGVTAGTYRSVTVDSKGRVTAGTNPTTADGYGLTDVVKLSGNQTVGGIKTFSSTITGSITGSDAKFTSITGSFSGNGSGITNINYSNISNPPSIPTVGNATVTIAAGNGLVNGGSLTTNQTTNSTITLNVGAGTGINVSADAVAIDTGVVPTLTANNSFTGTNTFTNITASSISADTIVAREYYTQLVSASVIYQSGSTKFGDTPGGAEQDVHQFSGSMYITGSNVTLTGGVYSGNGSGLTNIQYSNIVGTPVIGNGTVTVAGGTGISGSGNFTLNQLGNTTIDIQFDGNELPTSTTNSDGHYFVVVGNTGLNRKLTKSNINLSGFNNDAGWTSNTGTVTNIATGNGITGGPITTTGTIGLTGQALALHTLSTDGLIVRTSSGNVASRTISAGTGITVTNGNGVSGNPSIALTNTSITIGTTSISLGSSATTVSGLTSVASTAFTGSFSGNGSNITDINYSNIIGTPTVGNATVEISAGDGLQTGGSFTTNQTTASTITLDVDSTVVRTTGDQTLGGAKQFTSYITGSVTGSDAKFTSITGSLQGNSSTSTRLATSRTISSTGDVVWSVSFDGSGNATGTAAIGTGVIVNADINASAAISDTKLATISTAGKVSNSATTATSNNTANAIVARDSSGNFSAGTITAALAGNASTVTNGVYTVGDQTIAGAKQFSSYITGSITGSDAKFTSITGSLSGTSTNTENLKIVNDQSYNGSAYLTFVKNAADGYKAFNVDSTGLQYNPAANILTTEYYRSASGSATIPALSPSADSNTGVFYPAADTVAITTGGSEKVRIHSNGAITIGTTTATSNKLYVNGNGYVNGYLDVEGDSVTGNAMTINGKVSINNSTLRVSNGSIEGFGTTVFSGDGSGLTNINASNFSGIVPTSSLPSTIIYEDTNQTISGTKEFSSYITGSITGSDAKFTSVTGSFLGNLSGHATSATTAGSATSATFATYTTNVLLEQTNTSSSDHYLAFIEYTTGNRQIRADIDLKYNPLTNTLTAANFAGNATSATTATQVSQTLTRGSYLTGNNFNGSAATTWSVDATSSNTPNKVVARDASGNFSAGTITATLNGAANVTNNVVITQTSSATTHYIPFMISAATGNRPLYGNSGISYVPSTNTLTVGNLVETSTREIKENIKTISSQLVKIKKLNPVSYNRKQIDKEEIGLIAEEVQEVYPEFVHDKGINYPKMVSILIKAVQELTEKIEKQEKEIYFLNKKIK